MTKQLLTKTSALFAVATLSLVGCKTGTDTENFISHIKLSQDSQSFEYTTTFGSNVEINMEAEIPVGQYGSITFFKNDAGEFSVKLKATFDVFGDISLVPVTTLPNGMGFPSIVSGSMYKFKLNNNVNAYFDTAGIMGAKKLAGLSLQLGNGSSNLPQVTITQSYFTSDNKKFASLTVFGPSVKNGVTYPGGIFLVGDISQAIDSAQLMSNTTQIAGPDAHKYKTNESKEKLMIQVKKAFEANGIKLK
jgi:hypothetical protein